MIPIENDTDTVTTSNDTNLIKCCKRFVKEDSCCIGVIFFTVLFIIAMIVGLGEYKRKQAKVSISTNVSSIELVSKELNHLAAILHVYAGSLIFMK